MNPIRFPCAVAKVQTLADGGIRVTLDLPEQAIMAAAELMACHQQGTYLEATCKASDCKTEENNALAKGPKRKPKWSASEVAGPDRDS